MFVGRKAELEELERAYSSDEFEMVVVYGRRRVGKTTLLAHFSQGKPALFFTAQQQSPMNNLADFASAIADFFGLPSDIRFSTWKSALEFLAERAEDEPFLLVFDEFPYAAMNDGSLVSSLQIVIDHAFSNTKLCLILCGSDQGFMESEVLGKKSPLHGRRTSQIRVRPFDYVDAAKMVPSVNHLDAFRYYACIGGSPYYLSRIDETVSFKENIVRLFFDSAGFLYEEPLMLLRQELREPALYNSILRAIGSGANKQNEIADRAGIEAKAVNKYLRTLIRLDIVERVVPFGEDPERSRRGLYRLSDACYDFWYTFVMPVVGDIEEGMGRIVAENLPGEILATYLGKRFERVCLEWMRRQSMQGKLPIKASAFGQWWGTNPASREQDDIDVVAADRFARTAVLGECKWRNSFDESAALEKLRKREGCIKDLKVEQIWLFSKNPLSKGTAEKIEADARMRSITLADLYF